MFAQFGDGFQPMTQLKPCFTAPGGMHGVGAPVTRRATKTQGYSGRSCIMIRAIADGAMHASCYMGHAVTASMIWYGIAYNHAPAHISDHIGSYNIAPFE
jgi:hypothetical protein